MWQEGFGAGAAGAQGTEQVVSTEISQGARVADHRFRELLDAL